MIVSWVIFDREKFLVIHREWICIWCILCFKLLQIVDLGHTTFSIFLMYLDVFFDLNDTEVKYYQNWYENWFKVWLLAKWFEYFNLRFDSQIIWSMQFDPDNLIQIIWSRRFDPDNLIQTIWSRLFVPVYLFQTF